MADTSQSAHPLHEEQWSAIRAHLQEELGDAAFRSWLKPLSLRRIEDGEAQVAAPTRFLRDWVSARYAARIAELWNQMNPDVHSVTIDVIVIGGIAPPASAPDETAGPSTGSTVAPSSETPSRGSYLRLRAVEEKIDDLSSPLNPRFSFNEFVVDKPNEFAHAAARRVAEADKTVPFNPLYLYGGVGLGKTHLMHAIARHIRERDPTRRVLYLSAEKFMYHFVRALRYKDTMAFKEQFRSADVLMIDDVQFICGKDSTQEEFFHTFNVLIDHNRQVVISGDRSPSDLDEMEERLRSRLGWGLVADIHATTYELRLGILHAKMETSGMIEVPRDVLEFLARRISSNIRELEMALNRVTAHATLVGRQIDLEMAKEVLRDVLRASERRITIEEIQRRVAEHYNIKLSEMSSERRARAVARPRQVAMFLSKQLTSRSLPEIGRKFGGRDHTTVMHAVRRIEELRQSDAAIAEDVELLKRTLES
ncbi:MAG: chromosomal replication initiator protein DnaA [Rhodospirillaceae bacterium]|nr:chromosomal replication initiator protein DnaA [Rhodospirillaceae bacterium]MBT5779991.1 chromosomal replication initiator protein DnaA [Rhodospirillaceae bacterium]MBT7292231.1 chromosomal replication initiator protein DnaA [Rhodospirillaceae bacterium]